MSVEPIPATVSTTTFQGRIASMEFVDTDTVPDLNPISGKVRFTPSASLLRHLLSNTLFVGSSFVTPLDEDGNFEITVVSTDDPDLNPVDWTYAVTFELDGGKTIAGFSVEAPSGATVDITAVTPVVDDTGTFYLVGPSGTSELYQAWLDLGNTGTVEEFIAALLAGGGGGGGGPVAWTEVTGKPTTFPPAAHGHLWSEISSKPSTFPPDAHSHAYSDITGKPSTFPPSAHAHDWTEILNRPVTFAPSAHQHPWTDITDKPTTYPPTIGSGATDAVAGNDPRLTDSRTPTAHTHDDRYFTESEADARFAAAAHNHDSRYYTETETDGLLSGKAASSHTHTSGAITDFTEAVQDAVAAFFGVSGGTVTYDDVANTLTLTIPPGSGTDAEVVRDTIGAALIGVGNISVVVNDAADTITISTTATVNSTDASLRDRSTHTGTQSLDTTTDSATRLAMTASERSKLSGVATGATQNSSDASLRDRSTHTGVQTISTITGLQAILDTIPLPLAVGAAIPGGTAAGRPILRYVP